MRLNRRSVAAALALLALALASLGGAGLVAAQTDTQDPPAPETTAPEDAPPEGTPPEGAPPGAPPPPPLELEAPPVEEQNFVVVAEGLSQGTSSPGELDQLDLELAAIFAPYGITDLTVRKFLDSMVPPPFPVTDGVYTFTATNGDTLVLAAEGIATIPPQSPEGYFTGANETWTVESGTGRFEGAEGTGKVYSAVAFDVLGVNRSAVLKYFVGRVDLEGS